MSTTANIAKYQKFEARTINRKEIKNAPYNPRKISDSNLNLLKRNIKRVGLVETLVWNKLTGNLVSGHQRLSILDTLEKRDDYDITVAVVELDDKTEKEQNIFLNNHNAQGEWDRDLMLDIVGDIDLKEAGFTDIDLSIIGIELDLERHQNESVEEVIDKFETIKAANKEVKLAEREKNPEAKDWKDVKQDIKKNNEEKGSTREDYFAITFNDYKAKEAFLKRFGFQPDERYLKGEVFEQVLNDKYGV